MVSAIMMMHAQSELYISVLDAAQGEIEIISDTITISAINPYTGDMECKGFVAGSDTMMVTVTRSVAGKDDQLCAADNCVPGNQELTQEFHFSGITPTNNKWFTHYAPEDMDVYTVSYDFKAGDVVRHLTIVYNPAATALSNPMAEKKQKPGVYTILGQQLRKTSDTEGLPAGMYVVNGKKVIVK